MRAHQKVRVDVGDAPLVSVHLQALQGVSNDRGLGACMHVSCVVIVRLCVLVYVGGCVSVFVSVCVSVCTFISLMTE